MAGGVQEATRPLMGQSDSQTQSFIKPKSHKCPKCGGHSGDQRRALSHPTTDNPWGTPLKSREHGVTPYAGANCMELGKALEQAKCLYPRALCSAQDQIKTTLDPRLLVKELDRLPQHLCLGRLRKSESKSRDSGLASISPRLSLLHW